MIGRENVFPFGRERTVMRESHGIYTLDISYTHRCPLHVDMTGELHAYASSGTSSIFEPSHLTMLVICAVAHIAAPPS